MNEQLTTRPAEGPSPPGGVRGAVSSRRARLGVLIGLVVLIGVILWLTVGRSDSSSSSSNLTGSLVATPIAPVALSQSGLSTLARTVGQPIYWAGPRQGFLYELHRTANGNVYIRYLPQGVAAGAPGAKYLTVATYPFRSALPALNNVTSGRHVAIASGGVVLVSPTYDKSVHLAYPKVNYQVEVYSPTPGEALSLAQSGQIQPAG
jgi:hypothetical protein